VTSPRDLDQQLAFGVAWVGGLRLAMQLISWSSTLIVVRLISPHDYGVAGMAAVYVTFAAIFVDFGISGAVVVLPELTDEDMSHLHSLALMLGALGCVLSLALAWPLGIFFREPLLPPVVAVLSSVLLLTGLRTVPRAVMQRRLEFRNTAMLEAAKSAAQTVVVLIGAVIGLRYWALIASTVAGSLLATILALHFCRIPIGRLAIRRLEQSFRYARNILIGGLAWKAYSLSDFIVVGRTRGSQALGHYALAWNVTAIPGEKLTNLLSSVSSSFFASLRHDTAAMRRYFLVLSEGIALLTFAPLAGIAFVASDAVLVLWGEQWSAAILPMRLLAGYAMLQSLTPLLTHVLHATGQVAATRRNSVLLLAVLVPAFYVTAVTLGISAVAMCWLVLYPLVMGKLFLLVRATLSLSVKEYWRALEPAVLVTATMLLSLALLRVGVTRALGREARLVLEIAVGIGIGLTTLRVRYWSRLRAAWRVMRTPYAVEASP